MSLYKLQRGIESPERVELLLKLTRINSEPVRAAVKRVLVHGEAGRFAAYMVGIDKKAVYRALDRLNYVNEIVEKIKEVDLRGKR